MQSRFEPLFYSCPETGETDLAPLSPFMEHVWRAHSRETPPAQDNPAERAKFVFTFLETYRRRHARHDIPVPDAVIQWVNQPALDLTTLFSEEPVPGGLRKRLCRRYLTRLMVYCWGRHKRRMNVFNPAGYYSFLAWFAAKGSVEYWMPRSVIPDDLVELLNYPAVGYGEPLSIGMYVLSRKIHPKRFQPERGWSREDILAASYEGLSALLPSGDVRLLPDYVTRFWSARPFADLPVETSLESFLTAFEYTTARVRPKETGVGDGFPGFASEQKEVRRWFLRTTDVATPGNLLFSGFVTATDYMTGKEQFHQQDPVDHAIALYRDKQIIAGLARAAEATSQALTNAGHNVTEFDYSLSRSRMVQEADANESIPSFARHQIHLLGMNPEYVPECIACNFARIRKEDYVIGQFYWELSSVSRIHEFGIRLVDEIWVASEYLRELYSRFTSRPVVNMRQAVIRPRIVGAYNRRYFGLPEHAYTFLLYFDAHSSIARKNPLAAVQAFQQAFPPGVRDVALVVKTRNARHFINEEDRRHWDKVFDAAAADLRIQILDSTLSGDEIAGLNNACDVYVSLHRSEGFGFGPAEAMVLGKPVIVTNYSGVTDFCTAETAMLVDCREIEAPPNAYPFMDADRTYRWAEPDADSAAAAFRALYEDRDLGRRLGEAGRQVINAEYSVEALSRRLNHRLAELGFGSAPAQTLLPALAGGSGK